MTDERLDKLESKFAHQDDFIFQLNKIVADQQSRLERLEKEVRDLRGMVTTEGVGSGPTGMEKPPHY